MAVGSAGLLAMGSMFQCLRYIQLKATVFRLAKLRDDKAFKQAPQYEVARMLPTGQKRRVYSGDLRREQRFFLSPTIEFSILF